ncbi:MAG TPA: cytidine deaminase [Chitinophagales bacterium]|nr:cytidine deaminase [Chitinophagales bacterium]
MQKIQVQTTVEIYDSYESFTDDEKKLFSLAHQACHSAYAPYSQFQVGAAVWLADGQMFIGNNQENAAYPSGLCAERVALFYASALNPKTPIKAIAVTVNYEAAPDFDEIISPCGSCRQAIVEYEYKFKQAIVIYMLGKNEKVYLVRSMNSLLPFFFSGDVLSSFQNH